MAARPPAAVLALAAACVALAGVLSGCGGPDGLQGRVVSVDRGRTGKPVWTKPPDPPPEKKEAAAAKK